jgi:hypothetical protein
MATIFTTCPITGREISTGIDTDAPTLATMPEVITRIVCPVCGQTHNWSRHNAVLRERKVRPWPKSD